MSSRGKRKRVRRAFKGNMMQHLTFLFCSSQMVDPQFGPRIWAALGSHMPHFSHVNLTCWGITTVQMYHLRGPTAYRAHPLSMCLGTSSIRDVPRNDLGQMKPSLTLYPSFCFIENLKVYMPNFPNGPLARLHIWMCDGRFAQLPKRTTCTVMKLIVVTPALEHPNCQSPNIPFRILGHWTTRNWPLLCN